MKNRFLISLLVPMLWIMSSAPLATAKVVEEEEIELQMREIAKTLRCAVCQNESVWESQAGLALQMQDLIRERLLLGDSPEEVRNYFFSRYGDYILLAPRKAGLNWILWIGPFVLLLVGGVGLTWILSRWVSRTAKTEDEPPPIDDRLRKRIDEALHSRED